MSLFSGAKNNKFYYPPILKVRKNNIHLSDINNLKNTKNKKINNISLKSVNQILQMTKSNSYNNIINANKKNDFYIKDQDTNNLLLTLKNRSNSKNEKYNKYVDNEALYEKNIQLKTEINQIKKELQHMKAENQRKEQEIIKKDKLLLSAFDKKINEENDLESIFYIEDKKNNNNENNILEKDIKKNNYMARFKKQYNELKKKYEEKISQINSLKKNIKISKLNELTIQNKEILKEFYKLKELYINLLQENKKNIEKIKKLNDLENELNDKNLIILQLQESLKISSSTNIKYENDFEEMKTTINKLQIENKNLLDKLKKLYESYNKMSSHRKENENKFLGLYDEKRKSDINFNNTNRSYLNLANKINTDIRSKNFRNSLNNSTKRKISPLAKKIPISSNNSNIKKYNNNEINISNSINNNLKRESNNEINVSKIKENEINNNEEEEDNENNDIIISENIETNRSFNDISQCSYMLIKNFEACKISKEDSLTIIIKPILNEISNEKQIKNDILVNLFTNKICECINCTKNDNDINSINGVINSLLNESKNELFSFIQAFLDIFDSVKIYTDNLSDEENIIKKINISLFQYKEYFQNSYTNKFISFSNFRGLLNNKNIILDDESIEYVIYRMKKDCPNIISRNTKQNENIDKNNIKNNKNENNSKENKNDNDNKNNNNIIINNDNNNNDKNNGIININNTEEKNIIINNNENNILINLNNEQSNNNEKKEEIPVKIVNISIEEENNKKEDIISNKKENKNEENNEISNHNENCSIFDLNYKTFLNLI